MSAEDLFIVTITARSAAMVTIENERAEVKGDPR
jgi:hypothetical protein